VKAVRYRIDLSDGTYLEAVGEHASLIYLYLMECEKLVTEQQLGSHYLAPEMPRYLADGTKINTSGVKG